MQMFNRLFEKKKITSNGNFIHELFAAKTPRKTELVRASLISVTCLHESGHVMMAELHGLPVKWVNLPRVDNLSSPKRPRETDEDATPCVSVPESGLDQAVPYLLGGLFGELNIYDDDAFDNTDTIHAFTYGWGDDLKKILDRIKDDQTASNRYRDLAISINDALNTSRKGADRAIFLNTFRFQHLPEFLEFRRHRDRHLSIAAQLYEKWKAVDFEHLHELNPHFGS